MHGNKRLTEPDKPTESTRSQHVFTYTSVYGTPFSRLASCRFALQFALARFSSIALSTKQREGGRYSGDYDLRVAAESWVRIECI